MPYYISPPPQSPLTRLVAAIVAAFALLGAFMIGAAALLVVAGVGVIAGLILWLRVAWVKHQLKKNGIDLDVKKQARPQSGHVIDAEYTVISEPGDQDEK